MVRWLEIVGCPVCGERDPVIRLIECTLEARAASCIVFCQRCGKEFHGKELKKGSDILNKDIVCPCCYQTRHESNFYWILGGEYEGLMGECGNCRRIFLFDITKFQ